MTRPRFRPLENYTTLTVSLVVLTIYDLLHPHACQNYGAVGAACGEQCCECSSASCSEGIFCQPASPNPDPAATTSTTTEDEAGFCHSSSLSHLVWGRIGLWLEPRATCSDRGARGRRCGVRAVAGAAASCVWGLGGSTASCGYDASRGPHFGVDVAWCSC